MGYLGGIKGYGNFGKIVVGKIFFIEKDVISLEILGRIENEHEQIGKIWSFET